LILHQVLNDILDLDIVQSFLELLFVPLTTLLNHMQQLFLDGFEDAAHLTLCKFALDSSLAFDSVLDDLLVHDFVVESVGVLVCEMVG